LLPLLNEWNACVFFANRLEAYIGKQLWKMLGLTITLVTLIVFFSDTLFDFLKEMQDLGLPLSLAFEFLVLQVPLAFAFAFPPSVFFTVFLVYSHLNQQFELIALRMNGVSLWRIFRPAFFVGLVMAILTFASTQWLIPFVQNRADDLREEVLTSSQLKLSKDGIVLPLFKEGHWVKLLRAEKASLNHLEGFTFVQRSQNGNIEVIQADSAEYQSPQWQLKGVRIFSALAGENRYIVNGMNQVQKSHLLDVDEDVLSQAKTGFHHSKVGFSELARYIKSERQAGRQVPPKWVTMLWERVAQPLNCLALMFMAFPLALAPPRQSNAKGFMYAVLALFALYIARNISISLGQGGLLTFGGVLPYDLSLALACLLPTLFMLGLGVWMIRRKSYFI
jgi:LPS export ABC transporter permease LptG